ncbi:MAG: DUF3299 domain-containing protein [Planctomycetes bacterium]|nr:DUF3299 domain-containing protein [Planctomycetota bacterium]
MPLFQESSSISPTPPSARYRAVDPLAVVGVVVGGLSILTVLGWWLAAIPLVGIGLGLRSRRRILDAPDVLTGLWLAKLGIWLSAALWLAGYGWLTFAEVREVPFGYQHIKYETLQPDPAHPTQPIPQTALEMDDKKVFVQGYMQPRRQQTHIKEFILCPSSGNCLFCTPDPKSTEMIRVILGGDMETNYTTLQIGVAGRFRVDPDDPSGIPYGIEADILR